MKRVGLQLEQIAGWRAEAKKEVDATAAKVQREPSPDPAEEDWRAVSHRFGGFGGGMITYLEAIRSALARALADDPRVFLYGQDIGAFRRSI